MSTQKISDRGKLLLLGVAGCGALWAAAMFEPAHHANTNEALAAETHANNTYAGVPAVDTAALAERESLRVRLAELERKLSAVSSTQGAAQAPGSATDTTTRSENPPDLEGSEFLQQAAVARRLDQEPVDEAWQSETEGKLVQAFKTSPETDAVVLGAACRSNHCRVQLDLDAVAPDDRQLAISRLMSALPWDGLAFYQPVDLAERGHGALYVSREGRQTALTSGQITSR